MFTNALAIAQELKTIITAPALAVVPGMTFNLDEPVNLVWDDLPVVSTYPVSEEYNYDESTGASDKKHLRLRIEVRVKSGPASVVCTPVVNAVCAAIKANRSLNGLAQYVELQTIQWANDNTGSGVVSGAAVDVLVQYFTP